jgi:hypothetical protein
MIHSFKETIKDKLWAFYTQRIHRSKSKRKHAIPIPSVPAAKKVGLLYTYEQGRPEKTAAVRRFAEKITAIGPTVYILSYQPNEKSPVPRGITAFTRQDIDYWGRSNHKGLIAFWETSFDHLYYLDLISEPITDYVIVNSKAHYKIAPFIAGKVYLFDINFKSLLSAQEKINYETLLCTMLTSINQLQLS